MRSILCFDKQKVNRVLSVSLLGTYLDSRADTPTRPLAVASISFFKKKNSSTHSQQENIKNSVINMELQSHRSTRSTTKVWEERPSKGLWMCTPLSCVFNHLFLQPMPIILI
jgi:hypothetical protein